MKLPKNRLSVRTTMLFLSFFIFLSFGGPHLALAEHERAWIEKAIIYGIAPRYFSPTPGKRFVEIAERLPELHELGVNTIWLQPIFKNSDAEQGYHILDYRSISPDLGTPQEFRALVQKAHALGMKILLDITPNHVSIQHPWAQDYIQNGSQSPYASFFFQKVDDAPYHQFYLQQTIGKAQFISFFWKEMVNLDLRQPAVEKELIESCLYWVREFDVDGFRFDSAWAAMARAPKTMIRLRDRLQKEKPSLFLWAEDKAGNSLALTDQTHPRSAEIFDAVYDWTDSAEWVSEWSWQRQEETVFQWDATGNVAHELRKSIEATARNSQYKAPVVRFVSNNDMPPFISYHSLALTKLASTLSFVLPGIPLLYYGTEVGWGKGSEVHDEFPTFKPHETIQSWDKYNLWSFYQNLIRLRKEHSELVSGSLDFPKVTPSESARNILAIRRKLKGQSLDIVMNFHGQSTNFQIEGFSEEFSLAPYELMIFKNKKPETRNQFQRHTQ